MAANTTFTTGAVLTAAQMNNLPWGVVGTAFRNAGDVTVTNAQTDITGMSVTFTAVAGRLYRASWSCSAKKETAAGWTQITFADSANILYGISIAYGVGGGFINLSGVSLISGLTAGSKTFKLRGIAENNTSTVLANGNAPCQLIIEDMGAA
jgi:hypothetical protein